ncbi:hypothetical protein [Rhizobium sp. CSW-27]
MSFPCPWCVAMNGARRQKKELLP